ncbi:hypothetical protein BRC86_01590 [Halobacteriales archaeon QS_3_64_16]|nr:MAG: hypothetical protein BRC86_01590 [Halobacteriales archaeon QS_3_64_16]
MRYGAGVLGVVIPLFCDLAGKRVVIFGGGRVALRKARRFAPEADLSVHAPELEAGFEKLPCEVVRERVDAGRAHELLDGAFLAVVATDDADINDQFTSIAREKGCLVNRTDRPGDRTDAGIEGDADAGIETASGSATPRREATPERNVDGDGTNETNRTNGADGNATTTSDESPTGDVIGEVPAPPARAPLRGGRADGSDPARPSRGTKAHARGKREAPRAAVGSHRERGRLGGTRCR